MISSIRGNIVDWNERGALVFETSDGVGYTVHVSARDRVAFEERANADLGAQQLAFIRSVTREDGTKLYGFTSSIDRLVFDAICAVDGCGPAVAMRVLGAFDTDRFLAFIRAKDARSLAGVRGLGAKTIANLIAHLKEPKL